MVMVQLDYKKIRKLSDEKGWTLTELLNKAEVHHSTWYKIAQGFSVRRGTALEFAYVLGVRLEDIGNVQKT
ncbi:MAG: helix-turn-helix transcriptional regulator [Clostridia bacterium]|nr:helix-turn-helix transcriptional regulator [Clostridia bacterium]